MEEEVTKVPQAVENPQFSSELDKQQRIENRGQEILQRARQAEGEEGIVYTFFKSAIEEHSAGLGEVAKIHKELMDDVGSLDEPGASNNALTRLRDLYQLSGLGSYELVVELEGEASEEEKLKLTREKIKSDIKGFYKTYADHYTMEVYARPRAQIEDVKDELKEEVGQKDPLRSRVRKLSYQAKRREEDLERGMGSRRRPSPVAGNGGFPQGKNR